MQAAWVEAVKKCEVDYRGTVLGSVIDTSAFCFFNCYLDAPQPTLGHCQGGSLIHPMFIIAFLPIRSEGNEVGSLSPAERIVGFEPGTFNRLNPLSHSIPRSNV